MVRAHGSMDESMRMSPFVGRDQEFDQLDPVLARLGQGQGGPAVLDVTGEAGIGKSRLVAKFGAQVRARGLTVLRGQATESTVRPGRRAVHGRSDHQHCRAPVDARFPGEPGRVVEAVGSRAGGPGYPMRGPLRPPRHADRRYP